VLLLSSYEGIERIIGLRNRVRARLQENAEVVGTDEAFFEDDADDRLILDLYNEKTGILDGDGDTEVDLASLAYQIWKNAIDADPSLQKKIPELPNVAYSTRTHTPRPTLQMESWSTFEQLKETILSPGSTIVERSDRVTVNHLRAAECSPMTPAMPRNEQHHDLVRKGAELIAAEEKLVGGQLGRPSGARFRTYERLKRHVEEVRGTIFYTQELLNAIDEVYRYPLRPVAIDSLNRQLKSGVSDQTLAELVMALREEGRLCVVQDNEPDAEPQIICSLGMFEQAVEQ